MSIREIARIRNRKTGRVSSWETNGRNFDRWLIAPGETSVLAEIEGPAQITHIWMTQPNHYRECLIKITWDDAKYPSVLCPLGDFFGLGHGMVASYQSMFFTASTADENKFDKGCAFNCYMPMPFRKKAKIELINESSEEHCQYFYIDYETLPDIGEDAGYFHTEFRRANPFGGWGREIPTNKPGAELSNVVHKGKIAWDNNYIILDTKGRGHYVGCNISITNFRGDWWGEGDDMIWVDGYKWPPDLHGTGSEDYFGQAWGMQGNAFLRNGSSIFEGNTVIFPSKTPWSEGAYQTSYVLHVENPVRYQKEIKVTMECGHSNQLANEISSVAYWFADKPCRAATPPPVAKRMPVLRDNKGNWLYDTKNQCPGKPVTTTPEMRKAKREWAARQSKKKK